MKVKVLIVLVFLLMVLAGLRVKAGYEIAKIYDRAGNINIMTAGIELLVMGPMKSIGYKYYIKNNTRIIEHVKQLKNIE